MLWIREDYGIFRRSIYRAFIMKILDLITIISVIFLFFFFIISITIYKINQSKMDKIIESYIGKGLYLSAGVKLGRFLGVYGQYQVAIFFYMLLTGRRMRINEKDRKYMYQESYNFIQNLPSSLTHWIKIYFITINISGVFFFITMITFLFREYA
ncbi:hypothetical protein CKY06_13135 [Photorhabdus sp. S15-56]|uniref:Photorhabdus luminescens subsp. laumondii TTO1 complete genome segment 9/17 n=3 Tax=Photorhabdus TaxID=29487 RepID=Q7MB27_PHOLL|nr:hypothetical protein CKY15_13065 [Photorhabdus sp. S7-51]RAW71373.1 hypothetical protein CKY14_12540 [Photorhabdus sp. S14-60]RAW77293.1 hypothetical protein CKY06_13135 [Photorhabdus sp. S15-56]CAE14946.1 unnamed protein product [Photorhabdus laumondii subsp. laumondii TTO1]